MDFGDIIALLALVVSIGSFIYFLKERSNSLRLAVYERQLEACIAVYLCISNIDAEFASWNSFRVENDFDDDDVKEIKARLDELTHEIENNSLVLPNVVYIITVRIKQSFEREFEAMQKDRSVLYTEKAREEQLYKYEDYVRNHFGIEKLTKEYRQLT